MADHCLRSRDYVNVDRGRQAAAPPWLGWTTRPCTARGASASGTGRQRRRRNPDVVLACAGDVPDRWRRSPRSTLLRRAPARPAGPGGQRGGPDAAAAADRAPARADRPRVRRALHDRPPGDLRLPRLPVADPPADLPAHNHDHLHVRGYKEEGTTTTPFDMVMLNDLDRFHLVIDVIDRVPALGRRAARVRQRWSTTHGTGRGPASTARTCPRSATGPGRADAGSSWSTPDPRSLKLRLLADDTVARRAKCRALGRRGARDLAAELADGGDVDADRTPGRPRRRRPHEARPASTTTSSGASNRCQPLAPLHQGRALAGIRTACAAFPGVPAVACFDTVYHALFPAASTYALPAAWNSKWGLRRYGFHGLSHCYAARRLPPSSTNATVPAFGSSRVIRRRRFPVRVARRPSRRHNDGLHAVGRLGRWRRAPGSARSRIAPLAADRRWPLGTRRQHDAGGARRYRRAHRRVRRHARGARRLRLG